MTQTKTSVIIAPHPDDEIIGTYEILKNETKKIILYSGETIRDRREQSVKLRDYFNNIVEQLFQLSIPQPILNRDYIYYTPDPYFENHPLHRQWGNIGEQLSRNGFNVIFYTTQMNAPYIHEVLTPEHKKEILEKVYSDQNDLWKYDHRYFLFEGYNRWLF